MTKPDAGLKLIGEIQEEINLGSRNGYLTRVCVFMSAWEEMSEGFEEKVHVECS